MLFGRFFKKLFTRKKTPKKATGDRGEGAAARFLKKRGMKITARNYRCGRHEVDIIAFDGDCAVFVEVKTRSENSVVDGYYAALSQSKKRGVKHCAKRFLASVRPRPASWRYDVVDVRISENSGKETISHFENVPI